MRYIKLLLPLLTLLVLTLPAWAQSNNSYDLTWFVFDTGGTASGGQYEVTATLGQLDNRQSSGGAYTLAGRWGNSSNEVATPTSTATTNPTPVATSTPVTGGTATPTPPVKLYLPAVRH